MPNPWFRLYSEFSHDPKIQRMSEADQRRFVMLLCIRCSNGDVTLHDEDVTFQLRISNEEWQVTKALFLSKNLIDEHNNPVAWDKRQFVSDSSAPRVAKHRAKVKQACNVTVTPPDTEQIQNRTDTEQIKIRSIKRATVLPIDFELTENSIAYALNKKLNLETELVSFKNFHTAKGSTWKDWQATWRTWCDKAVEFGRSGNGKINGYQSIHDKRAEVNAILTGRKKNVHGTERDITGESQRIA
jgi:hypothetical protein